jgi:hypothetical protein
MSESNVALQPLAHLGKALQVLRDLGIAPGRPAEEAPIVAVIEQIAPIDEDKTVAS